MNINKILKKMTLWKQFKEFPAFTEARNIAQGYYKNILKLCVLSNDNNCFPFLLKLDFSNKNDVTVTVSEGCFFLFKDELPLKHIDEIKFTMTPAEFNKSVKTKIQEFVKDHESEKITKWCLISDLWSVLLNTCQI